MRLIGYVFLAFPVLTAYIFLNTWRAWASLPFDNRNLGLSGRKESPTATRKLGRAHRTTNIRQELNLKLSEDQPMSRGMTAQAMAATVMFPTIQKVARTLSIAPLLAAG